MNAKTDSRPPDPSATSREASAMENVDDGLSNQSQTPGAPMQGPAVDPATGHYGPGYGDPKRHYGNDPPPRNSSDERPPQPPDDNPAEQ